MASHSSEVNFTKNYTLLYLFFTFIFKKSESVHFILRVQQCMASRSLQPVECVVVHLMTMKPLSNDLLEDLNIKSGGFKLFYNLPLRSERLFIMAVQCFID